MKHMFTLFAATPVLVLGLLMASPTKAATYNSDPTLAKYEKQIFTMVNIHRVGHGAKALKWNDKIASVARKHSSNMAKGKVPFGHTGFMKRANTLYAQIPNARGVGENVVYTTQRKNVAKRAVDLWLGSDPHRKTMEKDKYTLTGVGAAKKGNRKYFTQLFVSVR